MSLKILLLGASGFIGQAIASSLEAAGHEVRKPRLDFASMVSPEAWAPHLAGVDAVINAIGVLRDSRARPMQAIHVDAPTALFEACARRGGLRVIQISALGIDGNPTRYARSKVAGEAALIARKDRLAATVVRPSIVFGPGGASARLFVNLARLPLLVLPAAALRAKVQPIAVTELAEACVGLLRQDLAPLRLDAVGPEALPLADFIASLRRQLGRGAARVLPLPDAPSRWSARLGDQLPFQPWCSETLALLQNDNVGDARAIGELIRRKPLSPDRMLKEQPWR